MNSIDVVIMYYFDNLLLDQKYLTVEISAFLGAKDRDISSIKCIDPALFKTDVLFQNFCWLLIFSKVNDIFLMTLPCFTVMSIIHEPESSY